ncbi:hypothetical protein HELRODRAFT_170901 [Helobdella robusta]|uniref:Bee-milk protein n=1 Tax=Helobdella robusta TaxID=6412 RepID=T1F3K6_HELRO|nr:hypothetical protein HELRODRAFT_170901 [Helobdella robusta]ESO06871.1 hypothetical protein HELRODRAFT_170901 [Helobdella robusta]
MNISSIGSLLGNLVASCCLAFYEMGTLNNDNYQQVGDARPAFHSPPQLSINFLNASLLPAASSQAAATSASGSGATSPSSSSSSSSLLNQSMGTSHQSNWYLIVGESQRLHVFNSSGLSVRIIGWGTVAPLAISVAPNGLVYVADAKLKSIRYYNTHLNWEDHSWRPNMFEFPSDLAMISTDDIIVADPVKKQVSRHDASTGLFLMTYRDPSEDYEMPSFIYVKNNEEVYILDVAKSSIFVFSENGYLIKKIKLTLRAATSHQQSPVRHLSPTSPPPSSPTPSSPSFVLRPSSLNAVCSKPSLPSGSACWQADRHNVNGFSVDGHGNILICDYIRDQIIIYSPDGQESHSLSTCSPEIQLKRPTRIIFSKTCDKIAVLEHDEPNNSSSIKLINLH